MASRLNPVADYIQQASMYIHKRYNIPLDQATVKVKEIIRTSNIKNPKVKYTFKEENGDTIIREDKITTYLGEALAAGEVIVPSLTTYYHPSVRKSIHADFMDYNVKERSRYKKQAFKDKQNNEMDKFMYNDTMQKTKKILNNSLSGAYGSKATSLFNTSAHYTLTSITRCVSSIGNAISESFIAGNRHFKDQESAYNYITAIITNIDKATIDRAMKFYKLKYPTVDDVTNLILNNTKWYWNHPETEHDIREYVSKLDPIELAAVMYINDLWSLKELNPEFVRTMLTKLSRKQSGLTNEIQHFTTLPEGIDILVKIICADDIKGMNLDFDKLAGTPIIDILASTSLYIKEQLAIYKLLFNTFYKTDVLPIDIAYIRDMLRDVIVLSDTDSTCGSYDQWVIWYYNEPKFTSEAISVAAVVMTFNGMLIDHGLKLLAKNMNISEDRVNLLQMKNEYYWSIFVSTNVNKHYFANTLIQEGNVYKEPELELKGVHLIGSSTEQSIIKKVHAMIRDINTTVTSGEKLSIKKYIQMVKDLEQGMLDKINSGDISIYKTDKIKDEGAYTLTKEESPYSHHIMWEEVFADKYGHADNPIYMVITIPTTLNTKKAMMDYVNSIQDEDIKTKWLSFIERYNKKGLGTFRPPLTIVTEKGLPEEFIDAIDKKKVILTSLYSAYMVLETLGIYKKSDELLIETI